MPRRNHITTQQAIDNFLFQRLRRNQEYQEFIRTTEVPAYITDNLDKDKQLQVKRWSWPAAFYICIHRVIVTSFLQ